VGKPEEKKPPGRCGCRWKDRTEIILKDVGLEGLDWIHLTQERGNENKHECPDFVRDRECLAY
jgi:hypothetical protein